MGLAVAVVEVGREEATASSSAPQLLRSPAAPAWFRKSSRPFFDRHALQATRLLWSHLFPRSSEGAKIVLERMRDPLNAGRNPLFGVPLWFSPSSSFTCPWT